MSKNVGNVSYVLHGMIEDRKGTSEETVSYATKEDVYSDLLGIRNSYVEWDDKVQESSTDFFEKDGKLIIDSDGLSSNYNDIYTEFYLTDSNSNQVPLTWDDVNKYAERLNDFVRSAFETSAELQSGDATYQQKMVEQRMAGPTNAGSSYEASFDEIKNALMNANWREITHPNVAEGCRCFITKDMPTGRNGIGQVADFPDDAKFVIMDPKNTGKVSIAAPMGDSQPIEDTTYLIIGKEEIDGVMKDMVYTFHPGEPLRPAVTETKDLPEGTILSKQQALQMGFNTCKFVSNELALKYGLVESKDKTNNLPKREKQSVREDAAEGIDMSNDMSKTREDIGE